jgi:hypothetical protein
MASKAENMTFPFSYNGTSNTPVLYIACTTTHAAIEVPVAFHGKFVKLINESQTTTEFVEFFFSSLSTAEVDRTVASSASGAQSPKLGERLYGTQVAQGKTPYLPAKTALGGIAKLYLIVESSAALNLRMVLTEQ